MNDYLSKPVKPAELIEALKRWLPDGKRAGSRRWAESVSLPAESGDSDSVWERDVFMERLLGDRNLAGEVLHGFLDDMPGKLEAMKSLADSGDAVGVRDAAHAIKGAASSVNAVRMSRAAFEVERLAASGGLDPLPVLVTTLEADFEELAKVVQSELREGKWTE